MSAQTRWTDEDLHKLDVLGGRMKPRIIAAQIGRTPGAVRTALWKRRAEHQRVENARKAFDVSRETNSTSAPEYAAQGIVNARN